MLENPLFHYFTKEQTEKIQGARVGIAGVGGLGSNAAMFLARCGVSHFIFIDYDTVEPSNLNRQQYFSRHVGMRKISALERLLLELHNNIVVEPYALTLSEDSMHFMLPPLLHKAPFWVEGFDIAHVKRLFVECALSEERFVVSASGFGGFGGVPLQKKCMGNNLVVVGDFLTDVKDMPPLAPRTAQAAAMQADVILEKILSS